MPRPITDIFDIKFNDLTDEMYSFFLKAGNREMEHQIGRLLHMKDVFKDISDNNIPGDFIEFGVYKGFSLIWMARLRDLYDLNDRKIIGVDSFEGLPIASTVWVKGAFWDTSEKDAHENLDKHLTNKQRQNIVIIKSWFNNTGLLNKLQDNTKCLALIHMDCDLKVSLLDAFSLIEPYLGSTQYLLLDDWGICKEEIPAGFNKWNTEHLLINADVISQTNITRYYRIQTHDGK